MKLTSILAALAAFAIWPAVAGAQAPQAVAPPAKTAALSTSPPITPAPAPAPDQERAVDALLDGHLLYALANRRYRWRGGCGIVKDGRCADREGLWLRRRRRAGGASIRKRRCSGPGSVPSCSLPTAVMQQVEAGKIDLDADVNTYLDFKIPPYEGKPITMRDLMTHTAGFAETIKHLFPTDTSRLQPLDKFISRWTPNRIYPPGEVPAYSNYGAALAGYIVQRTSGEPFDALHASGISSRRWA